MTAETRRRLLFVAKFLVAIGAAAVLLSLTLVDDYVIRPFSAAQTSAAAVVLRAGRQDVRASGTLLTQRTYAVDVKNGCNGIEVVALLVAALAAFPAPWRARLAAIVIGALGIIAVNIVRIVTLFVILRDYPKAFDFMHTVVWQAVLFLLVIGFFVKWSSRHAAVR